MSTFGDLVDEVHSLLHSFTGVQEQVTYLTAGVSESDLALPLADGSAFTRGLVEIGDELIETESGDSSSVRVFPFGRGARGTVAQPHPANSRVTFRPLIPRFEIKRALNQVVNQVYPMLFRVQVYEFPFAPAVATYSLPAEAEGVLRAEWELVGPSNAWASLTRFQFDNTRNEFTVLEPVDAGRTVKVLYRARPDQFTSESDALEDRGVRESWSDVLVFGAAAKLTRFLDMARLQPSSVENLSRSTVVQPGDAGRVANQFTAVYTQRLNEERRKLLDEFPPQMRYVR